MRDRERNMSRAELARSALVSLSSAASHLGVAHYELKALGLPTTSVCALAALVEAEGEAQKARLLAMVDRTKEEGALCG